MAEQVKMVVVRGFWLEGKALAIGQTFDCDPRFARELQANGKAEPAPADKPAPRRAAKAE